MAGMQMVATFNYTLEGQAVLGFSDMLTLRVSADTWDSENQSEFHEEYFYHMTHEELSSLLKDIKECRDVWNIAHSEWAIDLCEDYELVSQISTGVSI